MQVIYCDYSHIFKMIPNVRSTINDKKRQYKSVKTWNEIQNPKIKC